MSKPLMRTPGPVDPDAIAWAVRETLLTAMLKYEEPPPAPARLWQVMVKLTALALILVAFWQAGRAMGWQ